MRSEAVRLASWKRWALGNVQHMRQPACRKMGVLERLVDGLEHLLGQVHVERLNFTLSLLRPPLALRSQGLVTIGNNTYH